MASLRANLQKAIFQEDGERLLAVANIKKDLKKRKELYMCLVGYFLLLVTEKDHN